jgi:hypothetical protein
MNQNITKKIRECFAVLSEKYKIDIAECFDFIQLCDDIDEKQK